MQRIAAVLSYAFIFSLETAAQNTLIFNEIQTANIDRYIDPSWNYGGWVEIYNPSTSALNLRGYWLSDDATNLKKVPITESTTIKAKGYKNLWFDHYDQYYPRQINMKLDADGGTLYLSNTQGKLVCSVEYPVAVARSSWTRKTDGSNEWGYTDTPTPEASNGQQTLCSERTEAPTPSKESGFFTDDFAVRVPIPKGAVLRFTTDGSTPTLQHGQSSINGVFIVKATTIFRFALFGEGKLSSEVVTRTYLKKDKSHGLPVMAIATHPDNLYSNELGIFVKGVNGRPGRGQTENYNWNMDWDRPINVEFMDEDGNTLLNQETDMLRCGGWSRSWTPYCFKIHAAKQYEGRNTLNYAFFDGKPHNRYKTLQIRNGGTVATGGRVKDAFLQKLVLTTQLNIDAQDYLPVMHYINGVYQGVINVREPSNKHFVYANYGLDEEDIDMFEIDADSGYVQKCGTKEAYLRLHTLSTKAADESTYKEICQLLDIDEFCNYMAVQFYLGNTDWPQNNMKAWRPRTSDGRFRFVIFDLDFSFSTYNSFAAFAGRKKNTFNELLGKDKGKRITQEIEAVTIFCNLLENESFRRHFTDAFCLVAGSVFDSKRCEKLVKEMTNRVYPMQILKDEAYGRNLSPWPEAQVIIDALNTRAEGMYQSLTNYAPFKLKEEDGRNVRLSSNMEGVKIEVNGQSLPTDKFDGRLFLPVVIAAKGPAGYVFDGWYDGSGQRVSELQHLDLPEGEPILEARFSRDEENVAPPITINEVSAGNSIYVDDYFKKSDWVELHNNSEEDIDLAGMYLSDNRNKPFKYVISAEGSEASTIIPAHGYKVIWCDKKEPMNQLHAPFKLANEDGAMVLLTAADESWTDSLSYVTHDGMQSVGRFPDGGKQICLMTEPTIGTSNRMNSYTTPLTDRPKQIAASIHATHSGSMSIALIEKELLLRNEDRENVTLSIHSAGGTLLASSSIRMETGRSTYPIQSLPHGIYVADICDAQGNHCTLKFTKE